MVDKLAQDYERAKKPVFMLEVDLDKMDTTLSRRRNMWFAARGAGNSAQTPLVMIDSGFKWAEGAVQFEQVYKQHIDDALARPPVVQVNAWFQRSGNTVDVTAKVTNWGEDTVGGSDGATVTAILYEDWQILHTHRSVRAAVAGGIGSPLAYGETGSYRLQFADISGFAWSRVNVVVVVDHRSGVGNAFDALQAALAVEGVPPTATPQPTDPPTPTEVPPEPTALPTDVPAPTATDEPTATPVAPTVEVPVVAGGKAYVPVVFRRFERD